MAKSAIIKNRRFLDDEQLIRSEQLAVLEEIFNANVRDAEIQELSSHFAGILRDDHPCHLAVWGKTGTGKTLTLSFFLNLLAAVSVVAIGMFFFMQFSFDRGFLNYVNTVESTF